MSRNQNKKMAIREHREKIKRKTDSRLRGNDKAGKLSKKLKEFF